MYVCSVVDPKLFFSDPDLTFHIISDLDPVSDPAYVNKFLPFLEYLYQNFHFGSGKIIGSDRIRIHNSDCK